MKKLILQLFLFTGFVVISFGQTRIYYVSTSGNDNNDGRTGSPFRTIQKAADLMNAGDTCIIMKGTYRETVIPARSGTSGNPIVFMSQSCEKVVISGTDIVTNQWTVYKGNIYKTYMPWTMGVGKDLLFADSNLVVQARHPNKNSGAMKMPPVTVPLSPL